jgi:hypothetical protein
MSKKHPSLIKNIDECLGWWSEVIGDEIVDCLEWFCIKMDKKLFRYSFYILFALFISYNCMMLYRNNWVCKNQIYLINNDFDSYCKLQNRDYIMHHFWIWDFSKFVKK